MGAVRGKAMTLTTISKFINSFFNLTQPSNTNRSAIPLFMRLQFYSSMDGYSGRGQSKNTDFNEFNDHNSDKGGNFNVRNGQNLGTHQKIYRNQPNSDRPLKGERQKPGFKGRGRNDGFSHFDGTNEGRINGDDEMMKKDGQPSISELLNRPGKGEKRSGQEGTDFLEKFKLGSSGNKENDGGKVKSAPPLEEEKMEPTETSDVIFKKMKQTGLIPNAVAMLDGLCKDGLVQEAMKLFGLMREKGTMPEVVVYTAVVDGFCRAQKFDDAVRIFRKMQSNGIAPNAFSYTVLIKSLCKGKRLDDAVDFSVEMLEAGHSPNVMTFIGLVHEFCNEKGVEEAQKIIDTLRQKGYLLDEKAVRNYLDKTGPRSPLVSEAVFGPKKKSTEKAF